MTESVQPSDCFNDITFSGVGRAMKNVVGIVPDAMQKDADTLGRLLCCAVYRGEQATTKASTPQDDTLSAIDKSLKRVVEARTTSRALGHANFVFDVLQVVAYHRIFDNLRWRVDIVNDAHVNTFFVRVPGLFAYNCDSMHELTPETLPKLSQAIDDVRLAIPACNAAIGCALFTCREQQALPLDKDIMRAPELEKLFMACTDAKSQFTHCASRPPHGFHTMYSWPDKPVPAGDNLP